MSDTPNRAPKSQGPMPNGRHRLGGPEGRQPFEDDLYDLFCFLVTAARQLPREPDHYGPMRLAEAACRVASVAAAWASDAGDLRQVVDELMTARRQALNDPDAFLAGLDRVILRCADLERKRLAEGETPA